MEPCCESFSIHLILYPYQNLKLWLCNQIKDKVAQVTISKTEWTLLRIYSSYPDKFVTWLLLLFSEAYQALSILLKGYLVISPTSDKKTSYLCLPLYSAYRNESVVLAMLSFRQDFIIPSSREDRWVFSPDSCWEGNRRVPLASTWVSGYINILVRYWNNCICLDTLTICFHCLLLFVYGPQLCKSSQ